MKKIALALAAAGLAFSLSACGNPTGGVGEVGTFDGSKEDQTNKGNVQTLVVNYEGKPLTCLRFNPGGHSETITCDFVKYHAQDSNGTP
jgi:hypothetical protein